MYLGTDTHAGNHRACQPSDGAIPRYSSSDRAGVRHLHRSQRGNRAESGYRAAGGRDQRRGEHDVHDLLGHQYRQRQHQRLFQAGHRPGHGRRQPVK